MPWGTPETPNRSQHRIASTNQASNQLPISFQSASNQHVQYGDHGVRTVWGLIGTDDGREKLETVSKMMSKLPYRRLRRALAA